MDLQQDLLHTVDEGFFHILIPPRRRGDQLIWVGRIYVHQNFVKPAQTTVSLPWIILRKTTAATEMLQWSVAIPGLVPHMVACNKAASPTQKQFLVPAVRSEIRQQLERPIFQNVAVREVALTGVLRRGIRAHSVVVYD